MTPALHPPSPAPPPLIRAGARSLAVIVPVMVGAYAVGALVRYGLIEREDLGHLCESDAAPAWCPIRLLVIHAFLNDVFGLTSVGLVLCALWWRSLPFALGAVAVGTIGMVLYGFTWSGVGVLCGLLIAGRLQAERHEHGEAERKG